MRARLSKIIAVSILIAALMFAFVVSAAAMDDTYRFDDLGMQIKLPKSYFVITRETPRGDEVFTEVGLDYDETMTAFHNTGIYLRAYDPEKVFQISMTVTKNENTESVNNYSDLTAAERNAIADMIKSDDSVSNVVEVKHNGNIFFDSERSAEIDGKTVYFNQSSTVVNGMQIDLTLQKSEKEIAPDEAKALTNAANSLSFNNIKRNTGAVFDWWRLLLWIGLLAAISIAVSVIYRQRDNSKKKKLEARRSRRKPADDEDESEKPLDTAEEPETFEESLGYRDEEEFKQRSEADEMAGYDISVRERDPSKGVSFFEDEGDSIDDGTDYFDTYFNEPTEKRTVFQRMASAVSSFFQYAITHIGYFFKNLFRSIFGKDEK